MTPAGAETVAAGDGADAMIAMPMPSMRYRRAVVAMP